MAFTIGAKLEGQFTSAFKGAQSSVQSLQTQINSLNSAQKDISSYQKTQQAIEKTRAKLQQYQSEYDKLNAKIQSSENVTDEMRQKLVDKGVQIDNTKAKLDGYEQKLDKTSESLQKAGVNTEQLGSESQRLGSEIDALKSQQEALADSTNNAGQAMLELAGAIGAAQIVKELGETLKACADEAIAFENSMAGVQRTVGGSESFLSGLAEDFKRMSTEIPITAGELAEIATTAGQLGIAQDSVESFTETMAKLATATDLSADEAATMLAQFSNITGVTDFERLGSVVAELGDATATTASKVVQMSQGMAASANLAGMSATDIMAVSAAVGSLGIEAQAGSTAMSTLISTLYKATETGDDLEAFASVAGMTAEQFKQAWATDAVSAMNSFIQGLNDVERNGRSAVVILDELGITNVRQTKAILGLASAGDLLSNTIAQAGSAWENNTALTEKASVMYETTQAKITMMQNALSNLQISIGDMFTPAIASAADALTGIIQPMSELISSSPAIQAFLTTAIVGIGGVTGALALYTAGAKVAAAASAALVSVIPGAKVILGVAAAVTVLAGGIAALVASGSDAQKTFEDLTVEFTGITEEIEEQQQIIDLAEKYKKLTTQIDNTVEVAKNLDFSDVDITLSASADATINPDDFLIEGDHDVTVIGEAGETIDADEFVNNHGIVLHASDPEESAKLEADAFVNGHEIQFTAEWDNYDDMVADVNALKEKAEQARADLVAAQASAADSREHLEALYSRLEYASSESQKLAIQSDIEETTEAIQIQESEVQQLQAKYETVAAQYIITASAADTWKQKSAEIAEATEELGISTAEMSGSIWDAVEAREALAKAEQAELKQKAINNLAEQAQTYAKAYQDYATNTRKFKEAQDELNALDTPDDLADRITNVYNQIGEALGNGADWNSSDVKKLRGDFEQLMQEAGEIGYIAPDYYGMGVAMRNLDISTEDVTQAQMDLAREMRETGEAADEADAAMQAYIDNAVNAVNSGAMTTDEVREAMVMAFAGYANGAEMVEQAMAEVEAATREANEAAEDFTETEAEISDQNLSAKVAEITAEMEALAQAYNEAYDAAYNSMSGQFDLFEEADKIVASEDPQQAVQDMIDALKSQQEYIQQYKENLEAVKKMGLSDSIVQELSDGSADSAQILADIVAGGADKIDELNKEFASVEEGRAEFANAVAEMETGFTEKMTQLTATMQSTVEQMSMEGEAAAAGAATMDAYAEAVKGKTDTVSDAFAQVAAAALKKLNLNISLPGFASGTESAPEGFAMVGEQGPELVYFGGGEQVIDANETAALMQARSVTADPVNAVPSDSGSGGTYQLDFAPVYNISGSMSGDELQSVLDAHDDDMLTRLEEMLEDIETDKTRRKYA